MTTRLETVDGFKTEDETNVRIFGVRSKQKPILSMGIYQIMFQLDVTALMQSIEENLTVQLENYVFIQITIKTLDSDQLRTKLVSIVSKSHHG